MENNEKNAAPAPRAVGSRLFWQLFAAVNFITGEAVSLVSIYSQPMQATRDLENYEAGYLGKGGTSGPARPERKWSLSVGPGGFTFRYEF